MKTKKIKVYYDGLCHLCFREMEHYKKQKGSENIDFVDISSPNFNAVSENLDPKEVNKIMHARDAQGKIHTRIDAFIVIWNALPRYRKISRIASSPFIKPVLEGGYSIFAFLRPYLPKRNSGCETSPHCELHNKDHKS